MGFASSDDSGIEPMMMQSRAAGFRAVLLVFLLALGVRLAWVARFYSTSAAVLLHSPPFNTAELGNIASNLAAGRGFSSPFGPGSQPTAWECPLVPVLFAGLTRMAGPTGRATLLLFFVQAVLSALAAATYWLIAQKVIDRDPSRFAAWLSLALAGLVCLSPESVTSVTISWYYVCQEVALAAFVLFAMRWWDRRSPGRSISTGVSGGILALVNVTPVPIIAYAILFPPRERKAWRPAWPAVLAMASFAIVIAPWLVRNAIVFHTFVPLRSNTGYEIFQGNNEVESIRQPFDARHPASNPEELERYQALGEVRYCREALGRAGRYIRGHIWQTVQRTLARVYVSWMTDLTDHWNPAPDHQWWSAGKGVFVRHLISILLALASLAVVVWAALTGRFRYLPYGRLFVAILLLLPLPHYFTLADPEYTAILRIWVANVAVMLLSLRVEGTGGGAFGENATKGQPLAPIPG